MTITTNPVAATAPSLERLHAADDEVHAVIKRHKGTGRYWVFGSVARGEATKDSDYDLLVEFLPGASYFNLAALEIELSNLLHSPVEIMPSSSQGYPADHARSQAIAVNHGHNS